MFTIKFRDLIGKKIIYLDGGMGSVLQQKGLQAGELPEILNITNPQLIQEIHYEYYLSGSNVTYSNTFGANKLKYEDTEHDYKELIVAAIDNVRAARERFEDRDEKFIALDVGPIGKLLKPVGDLDFEEAVEIFKEVIKTGADAGADLIAIETMSDTYELKAAVLTGTIW